MKYNITFALSSEKILKKWKKSNPNLYKKCQAIIHELAEHPRTGTGHPEPLTGGNEITWSRRLSAHDRIIYDIYEDVITVLVLEVGGHYKDK